MTDPPDDPLRAFIAGLREEPERGPVTFRADATLPAGGYRCETAFRRHSIVVDEPPSIGGTNEGPNPLELMLGAVASCQAITYRIWAEILEIPLDSVTVEVEGDVDIRELFGLPGTTPGYTTVRLAIDVRGPAGPERYRELADAVDTHCPLLDTLGRNVVVEQEVSGASPAG